MSSQETIGIDTFFHQIVTTEHQTILRDALLKQCHKILEEIPPHRKYQYWDVYSGMIFIYSGNFSFIILFINIEF